MNQILKFHKKYYRHIMNGSKTQTSRLFPKYSMDEGDYVVARFTDGKELLIRITKIMEKPFNKLDGQDATKEGYDYVVDLKNDLITFYPIYRKDDSMLLYIYQFEVIRVC